MMSSPGGNSERGRGILLDLLEFSTKTVRDVSRAVGIELPSGPDMAEAEFEPVYEHCKRFTMTTRERMYALYTAVNYLVDRGVEGDFVEAGVWRGGSSMLIAETLVRRGLQTKKIYLYDTFEGMPPPGQEDVQIPSGRLDLTPRRPASVEWERSRRGDHNAMCYAGLSEVKSNLFSTGYAQENLVFVQGKVEETIPGRMPDSICLLRLDTDWYSSTRWELDHLFPKLARGGVLIIDDYGAWEGARKAVDEYINRNNIHILLNRIDCSGRIAVKV